jgi:hypothetical protein
MAYSYVREENAESIDYSFLAKKKGQIYTVTFDPTLYAHLDEKIPIIVNNGYGVLFYREQVIPKNTVSREPDLEIMETISEILHDFLASRPEQTYLLYQCENYREKIFDGWYDKATNSIPLIKGGVLLGVAASKTVSYLGFVVRNDDVEQVNKAFDELVSLSLEFL